MHRQARLTWEAAGVISVPWRPCLGQAGARTEEASTLSELGAALCTRASQGSPEAHLPRFCCTAPGAHPAWHHPSLHLVHSEFPGGEELISWNQPYNPVLGVL